MPGSTNTLLKAALSALHYSGAGGLLAPLTGGTGAILMLHHVTPEPRRAFEPNGILKVTPEFLEAVIGEVRRLGFDTIALDDVPERLKSPTSRPFVAVTLDDGYKDNAQYAYPVLKRLGVPFTIYVPTSYADGHGDLWWLTLEEALRRLDTATVTLGGEERTFALASSADKASAFDAIYWALRAMPEADARALTHDLARKAGFDPFAQSRDLLMSWDEVRTLAQDPLVTIGGHTVNHFALAKLSDAQARIEMADSIARVARELGRPCRHFSYPYGCELSAGDREFAIARELGVVTAVTTRKGLLYGAHKDHLTALPRLSLNGDFQDRRYVRVLLSGVPFALLDGAKRMFSSRAAKALANVRAVLA